MRFLLGFLIGALLMSGVLSVQADSRPPIPGPVFRAVRIYWHSKPERVRAFKVIYCESRFHTHSVSPTGDYGLMQINKQAHSNWVDFGPRIFQARYNVSIGRRLYDSADGWSPWNPSRSCWS